MIEYNAEERVLWCNVYKKLRYHNHLECHLYDEYQISRMNSVFGLEKNIPQLEELSVYLQNETGFMIKPVHGIVSQRDFLNCFAFRIFPSTQYLRHTGTPDYTP